ncbi:ATP-binding protein [Pseudodesulfovibrio sp.]|uniref:sensor histidine kinase n=1 Tax=Pseudodesulfovibrio sp. TaxID=2035812 RepID=UPI0026191F39|nr:ATP-binding protein [Pseudodesulfovibrio sp.]MDD3310748.1 ATP-binding protein [Pseudodesulfovibrio sp.]
MTLCNVRRLLRIGQYVCPGLVLLLAWLAWRRPLVHIGIIFAMTAAAAAIAIWLVLHLAVRRVQSACDEQSELGNQLIQSQKILALGEISTGIAHEINNPLNIIMQEAELVRADLEMDVNPEALHEIKESLEVIIRQVERCSDITHKLLDFARKRVPISQPANLNRLMEDMLDLLERGGGPGNVEIVKAFDPLLPMVKTDPPLLRQVFLNLLINAVQAMEESGGFLYVTTYVDHAQVCVEVRDTGPGIPQENLERVFNPFFTTKEPGKGTGLGLSVSVRIVSQLGGDMAVRSEKGSGAAFTVCIPITA